MGDSVVIHSTMIQSNYICKWNKHFNVIVNLLCDHNFYVLQIGIVRGIMQYYKIAI